MQADALISSESVLTLLRSNIGSKNNIEYTGGLLAVRYSSFGEAKKGRTVEGNGRFYRGNFLRKSFPRTPSKTLKKRFLGLDVGFYSLTEIKYRLKDKIKSITLNIPLFKSFWKGVWGKPFFQKGFPLNKKASPIPSQKLWERIF